MNWEALSAVGTLLAVVAALWLPRHQRHHRLRDYAAMLLAELSPLRAISEELRPIMISATPSIEEWSASIGSRETGLTERFRSAIAHLQSLQPFDGIIGYKSVNALRGTIAAAQDLYGALGQHPDGYQTIDRDRVTNEQLTPLINAYLVAVENTCHLIEAHVPASERPPLK